MHKHTLNHTYIYTYTQTQVVAAGMTPSLRDLVVWIRIAAQEGDPHSFGFFSAHVSVCVCVRVCVFMCVYMCVCGLNHKGDLSLMGLSVSLCLQIVNIESMKSNVPRIDVYDHSQVRVLMYACVCTHTCTNRRYVQTQTHTHTSMLSQPGQLCLSLLV